MNSILRLYGVKLLARRFALQQRDACRPTRSTTAMTVLSRRYFCEKSSSPSVGDQCAPMSPVDSVLSDVVRVLERKGHSVVLDKDYGEKSIIPLLLRYDIRPKDIVSLMCRNVDFLNVTGDRLAPILKSFVVCGVRPDVALVVLIQEPRLLKESADVVFEALTAFLQLIPNKESLSRFLERHPSVLYENSLEQMMRTKSNLISFFSESDIQVMMHIYPELLLVNFDRLEDIYEYMHYVMGLGPRDLVRTRWFSYPLEFVRLRHEFVVRCGLYVYPDKKRPAVAKYNPPLKKIIDASDWVFAEKICGVLVEEYRTFETMYNERLRLDEEYGEKIRRRKSRSMQFSMDEDEWENYKLGERDAVVVETDDNPRKMVRHWSCKPARGEAWRRKRKQN